MVSFTDSNYCTFVFYMEGCIIKKSTSLHRKKLKGVYSNNDSGNWQQDQVDRVSQKTVWLSAPFPVVIHLAVSSSREWTR